MGREVDWGAHVRAPRGVAALPWSLWMICITKRQRRIAFRGLANPLIDTRTRSMPQETAHVNGVLWGWPHHRALFVGPAGRRWRATTNSLWSQGSRIGSSACSAAPVLGGDGAVRLG